MRTYTVIVTRNDRVLFEDDIPFFSPATFSRSVGASLERYRLSSGIDIRAADVLVSVRPKHIKPS